MMLDVELDVKDGIQPTCFLYYRFEFSLTPQELPNHSLEITVKNDKSMFSSSQSELGVIEINLSQFDTSKTLTGEW